MKETSILKRMFFIVVALAIVGVAWFMPTPEGLSPGGKMAIALLVSGIVMWVTEPVPMSISALFLMILMVPLGVLPTPNAVWANFISNVIFFVLASFGITSAIMKTTFPSRIISALLGIAKGRPRLVVLAVLVGTAIMSSLISDLACTALMSGIVVGGILKHNKKEFSPGKSNLGKCLLIGIPFASGIGGQVMPTGSSMNVMAMNMLEANTGVHVTFLNWTAICMPIAAIVLIAAWLSLVLWFKPEPMSEETVQRIEQMGQQGKLTALEIKTLAVVLLTIALWVASNWTGWDANAIAVLGLILFFVPGIDVLTWREYVSGVSWNIVMLIGGVQSLASGLQQQGAAGWLVNNSIGRFGIGLAGMAIAPVALLAPLLRLLVPVGPAYVATLLIPLTQMAPVMGISVVALMIIVATNGSTALLLGIDNNPMLVFKYGYWTMGEYFKAGVLPIAVMVACHSTILIPLVSLLGY